MRKLWISLREHKVHVQYSRTLSSVTVGCGDKRTQSLSIDLVFLPSPSHEFVVIGVSLGEPHTSGTALQRCVFVSLLVTIYQISIIWLVVERSCVSSAISPMTSAQFPLHCTIAWAQKTFSSTVLNTRNILDVYTCSCARTTGWVSIFLASTLLHEVRQSTLLVASCSNNKGVQTSYRGMETGK